MLTPGQILGKTGEDAVVSFLVKRGWRILERNYSIKVGEIDIIAEDRDVIVFVEVKTRRSERFGHPTEGVHRKKQQKISMTAHTYLRLTGQTHRKARFDVAAVKIEKGQPLIEFIRNAFDSPY